MRNITTARLEREEQQARVREALAQDRHDQAQTLLHDLNTCGLDWSGRYTCRSPICERCRKSYIRAEQASARAFFSTAENSELGLLTVVLGASYDLVDVETLITKGYAATRNRIDAARRRSAPWKKVAVKGWYEIDALGAEHIPLIGANRQKLISDFSLIHSGQIGPMWVPTFHAIIRHAGIQILLKNSGVAAAVVR